MGDYGYDPSGRGSFYGEYDNMGQYDDAQMMMMMYPPAHPSSQQGSGYSGIMCGGGKTVTDYYPQAQQHHQGFDFPATTTAVPSKDGSFYFHSEFLPQIYGCPVQSLAYDASYKAMYIASTTQTMSSSTRFRSHRASMLVTHNTADGMLYSSVAGHPEASSNTLQTVYDSLFGISKTVPLPPSRQHIPPHAYRAPFGSSQVDTAAPPPMIAGNTTSLPKQHGHMGITSILPLDGYTATVSPAAVRIHAHGGMQVHDFDMEGMMCGTIHPHSDQGGPTHISVGGIPCNPAGKNRDREVFCMDLWQGLKVVSARSFKDRYEKNVGVTAMATSHDRASIVAGCSDGYLRVLDGALREVATVKCHKGGVSNMSISPDGMLIATAGYSSKVKGKDSSILYAFPDPTVYIYDIRRLGRAGIPHPFAGARGSPHHVSFLPDLEGLASNRLLVGSGQSGGGLQVLVPFEPHDDKSSSFLLPQLEQGESISAMVQSGEDLALGTSQGRVLTYKYAGYHKKSFQTETQLPASSGVFVSHQSIHGGGATRSIRQPTTEKKPLVMPSFVPPPAPFPMDPKLLLKGTDPNMRAGPNEKARAMVTSFILQRDPKVSLMGDVPEESLPQFGRLGAKNIVSSPRRTVGASLLEKAKPVEGDFVKTIPSSELELDLLADHNPVSKRYQGKNTRKSKPNPNKLLYNYKLSSVCYDDHGGKRTHRGQRSSSGSSGDSAEELPQRYRLQLRPKFRSSGAFDPCDHNDTGLFPGWDYAPSMPNSFAPPVLLMLYFVPELLSAVLGAQYNERIFSTRGYEKALSPELGFLFHQIESLSMNGLLHPTIPGVDPTCARIGAWVPSNFLTALSTTPEAEQLQVLDESPAAVDAPRRPEAFYRFLAYQLDKELSRNSSDNNLLNSLNGIDFLSSNQFISGSSPPSHSSTRAMTLDLSYDIFTKEGGKRVIQFGELLQHSLCRETRLRAWNSKSRAYETIVQRKIVTSLPQVLTIACSCAGRKDEDGLWIWRTDDNGPWLPEFLEVELGNGDSNVIVKQLKVDESGKEIWSTFKGRSKLPPVVSKLVAQASTKQKRRYRLDAVLSFINDNMESSAEDDSIRHHVLHARVPNEYRTRIIQGQKEKADQMLAKEQDPKKLVLTSKVQTDVFRRRIKRAEQLLAAPSEDSKSWVLYNGFAVSETVVEDARAFHVAFKEPNLLVYRDIDDEQGRDDTLDLPDVTIPSIVMEARSLAGNSARPAKSFNFDCLYEGKLVAFDAEFVSVQEEESSLLESGSKVVLRETRHSLGRISVVDCDTRKAIIDDHVLPRERVVDYLTKFSGIVAEDLDPTKTSHNLISTRNAYLKLRYLMEQGCIFVGHGLRQDFATVNLVVPPNQILDTVEIYHQPGMRFISLRFLANVVLGRDMQQDVHDSYEDASAAFELYEQALKWKHQGIFAKKLQEIYAHGDKADWKIGVASL